MSPRRHGGARYPMVQRQEGGTLVVGRRNDRAAPHVAADRPPQQLAPAITLSREELARQLAQDPEFAELVHATMRAEWAVRR